MAEKNDPAAVESFDVAARDTTHVVVTLNKQAFVLDAQQVLALRGALNGAALNLNY